MTLAGAVRPGDPVADALFNLVMLAILTDVSARINHIYSVASVVPTQGPLQSEAEDCEVLGPTWVDDHVVHLEHLSPQVLLHDLAAYCDVFVDTAAEYGLEVNTKPGKTAALLSLRGPVSREVQ